MSDSRISLRHVRATLHIATACQAVLVALESRNGWRIVEYGAWLIPFVGMVAMLEFVLWGLEEKLFDRASLRPDLQALRLRVSFVAYLASAVTFTFATLVASFAYALLRVCVAPLHRRQVAWMLVDAAMVVAGLVWIHFGKPDPFQFASVLTVMAAIVTVAIYQDDTSR